MLSAREAVCGYYATKRVEVDPSQVVLTASTSEAYSLVFKLLCEPGDEIIVPVPSYPLFDYLAQVNDVTVRPYHLRYAGEWQIDIESMRLALTERTRGIVVVSPHNPTGHFLKRAEYESIRKLAAERDLALIVDEVFIDYPFAEDNERLPSTAVSEPLLTFTLNGISKSVGLPQLKLGWIVVSGKSQLKNEALARLEIMADTFLSVNTPVQVALPDILRNARDVRNQIAERVRINFLQLQRLVEGSSLCSALECEGGWYAVLRLPKLKSDEEWALELLTNESVLVFPGYFFEFVENGLLVVSLLPEEAVFADGVRRLCDFVRRSTGG
jgi:aspartate/methionine/tyrosine aminotransferase